MSNFTDAYIAEVCRLHSQLDKIRNMSVIAHVDHGKTTLVDSLLAKAGIISIEDAGDKHAIALRQQEVDRQITIKATGVSLPFEKDGEKYLINLVDSPGHVDFSSEVTAALRITDGALVVVDCVEGVCVQTETVTRQALGERIKPVLHVNKVDRAIQELMLSGEDLYQKLNQIVESVNALFATYEDPTLGDVTVDPRKGNVSFGSGKQGWAFTLTVFGKIFGEKMQKEPAALIPRLWGENFFDVEAKKFTDRPVSATGKPLQRYVVQMILDPLVKVFNTIGRDDTATLEQMLPKIGVKLTAHERERHGGDLLRTVMRKWLPAADALVRMVIENLPSPKTAQQYRVANLYTGPQDDENATAIRECNPTGPLNIFISKMIDPVGDGKRYFAFGRVFSGTVKPQLEVRILGPNFVFGEKSDCTIKKIPGTVLILGAKTENVPEVPCGNTVGISGLDKILIKSGTITSSELAHPIAPMKFSVAPVVRRAVAPKNTAQLKKFTDALKRLEKTDPCLQVLSQNNEFIIAGAGELHIEVALGELREMAGEDVPFTVSPPVVEFCESVTTTSSIICLGKSPNKHNRLYFTAEPVSDKLCRAIDNKKLEEKDLKARAKQLSDDFGWDKQDALKLWYWAGSNCVVDMSHGVQYLNEVKDSVNAAFETVAREGVLCGEPMRGIRFNLHDATLHADAIHRGGGQIIPTARRVFYAAMLAAKPSLVEPFYLAEIQTEQEVIGKIYSCVSQRRGIILEEIPKPGCPLYIVKAHLPVLESFGFDAALREATSGRGFPQLIFSHWQVMDGDPAKEGSLPNVTVMTVRKRKDMKPEIPTVEDYNDKL
jgi:elongation factor 2